MKRLLTTILCILFYSLCHSQDIAKLYDTYLLKDDPAQITVRHYISGEDVIELQKEFIENSPYKFPRVVAIKNINDLNTLLLERNRNKVKGIVLRSNDSETVSQTLLKISTFSNLEFFQLDDHDSRTQEGDLQVFPKNINRLTKLRIIGFSNRTSVDVDDAMQKIETMKGIVGLSFNYTSREKLPKKLQSLKQIKLLKIEGGDLDSLNIDSVKWELLSLGSMYNYPLKALSKIKTISGLYIPYCKMNLKVLPDFYKLKRLKINGSLIPDGGIVPKIKSLEWLSIQSATDKSITGIESLKLLTHLEILSYNSPVNGPALLAKIGNLNKLRELILVCPGTVVPDFFDKLKALKVLNVQGNATGGKFPSGIVRLSNLKALTLSLKNVSKLTDTAHFAFKHLETLKLRGFNLKNLPKSVLELSKLNTLDISSNQITTLPLDSWGKLVDLNYLALDHNEISVLPPDIGVLKNLEYFDASHNQIQSLPISFGNYERLEVLRLHDNNIESLPRGLANTPLLHTLSLNRNKQLNEASVWNVVTSVPRNDFRAELVETGLTTIPAQVNWSALKFTYLNLDSNRISSLPYSFAEILEPTFITLAKNNFSVAPYFFAGGFIGRARFKILYDELKIGLPANYTTDKHYAFELRRMVSTLFDIENWRRILEFSGKAQLLDSSKVPQYGYTGIAKYQLKDYKGAIEDFKKYFDSPDDNDDVHMDEVIIYQYEANFKQGDKQEVARLKAQIDSNHHQLKYFSWWLYLYMDEHDINRGKELVSYAAMNYRTTLNGDWDKVTISGVLELAEIQIMANKPDEAIKVLHNVPDIRFEGYLPDKYCILAMAEYLTGKLTLEEAEKRLIDFFTGLKKAEKGYYYFNTMNKWAAATNQYPEKRAGLLSLQKITSREIP
ncbi:MAG: leucine-rich repeat domain-containing protein [Bacteroidota bacterium]